MCSSCFETRFQLPMVSLLTARCAAPESAEGSCPTPAPPMSIPWAEIIPANSLGGPPPRAQQLLRKGAASLETEKWGNRGPPIASSADLGNLQHAESPGAQHRCNRR